VKRALLALVIVGAWLTVGDAQPVHACTCDSLLADAEAMLQSPDIAAVFVGTITGEQRPPERDIVSSADPVLFEFAVEEVYKGPIPAVVEIETARGSIDPLPVAATEDSAGDGWALPLGVLASVVAGGAAIVALLTHGRRRGSASP